jgi:hypothetical protein
MTPIQASALLAAAFISAITVAGCGSDESSGEESASEIQSGVVDGSAAGSTTFAGEGRTHTSEISFSGAFESDGGDELPNFDLALSRQESGEEDINFGLISTADAGYLEFQGQGYEIDHAVFERLKSATPFAGLDPTEWFASRPKEGREEIDGTETIHTTGKVNQARIAADLRRATRQIGLPSGRETLLALQGFFHQATLDLFTGAEDGILRRLELRVTQKGSSEEMGRFFLGFEFSVTLSDVNHDQEINAPEDVAPFNELVDKLPFQLSGLGEFLSGIGSTQGP